MELSKVSRVIYPGNEIYRATYIMLIVIWHNQF